jgi:hypothetical protein
VIAINETGEYSVGWAMGNILELFKSQDYEPIRAASLRGAEIGGIFKRNY